MNYKKLWIDLKHNSKLGTGMDENLLKCLMEEMEQTHKQENEALKPKQSIRKIYIQTGVVVYSNDKGSVADEVKTLSDDIGDASQNPDGDVTVTASIRVVDLHTNKVLFDEGKFH